MASRAKQQHFVPRFYLEYFASGTDERVIWTYDKVAGKSWAAQPESTATQENFYSIKKSDGTYFDEIEKWLSGIEYAAAGLYPKVLRGERLLGQERADFSTFLGSFYARSPALINAMAELQGAVLQHQSNVILASEERFGRYLDRYQADTGDLVPDDERRELYDFLNDKEGYTVHIDRRVALNVLSISDQLAKLFFEMQWIVVEVSDQHLVTSDSPVVRITPPKDHHPIYGDGAFLNPNTYVTLPLSPTRCLEVAHKGVDRAGVFPAKKDRGRLYNRQRAGFCDRFLYSSQRDAGIAKLGEKHAGPGLRLKVDGGGELAKVEVKRKLV